MKAVLVIDMPVDCPYCPMAHWNKLDEFTGCDAVSGKKYAINDKEYAESSCRPSWCPLRPLPQKMDANTYYRQTNFICDWKERAEGWNDCLDELLLGDAE